MVTCSRISAGPPRRGAFSVRTFIKVTGHDRGYVLRESGDPDAVREGYAGFQGQRRQKNGR